MRIMNERKVLSFFLAAAIVAIFLASLAGCAGTPTGDKAAKFATEYCDLSLMSRFAIRSQANSILQAQAAKEGKEPAYVCFDCPGEGDECTDRSK